MISPRNRFTAPRQTMREEPMRVDYADVLEQAVDNERWRVIRLTLEIVQSVATSTPSLRGYGNDDKGAEKYKKDLLGALRRLEQ